VRGGCEGGCFKDGSVKLATGTQDSARRALGRTMEYGRKLIKGLSLISVEGGAAQVSI